MCSTNSAYKNMNPLNWRIFPAPSLSRSSQPFNAPNVKKEIEELIQSGLSLLNREGAAIAISGGLDSAVTATLTVAALGTEKVIAVNLPERDSKTVHQKHAEKLAKHLGIKFNRISITSGVRAMGAYKLLPLRFIPTNFLRNKAVDFGKTHFLNHHGDELLQNRLEPPKKSWLARGNAYSITKHRLRMVKIYQIAELNNLMVVGAANRTEWLTGTFSKWGVDHCADIMPIMHLYRSEVEQMAEYLEIPEWIRNKVSDPDIIPGTLNKGDMLGGFSQADNILRIIEEEGEKYSSNSEGLNPKERWDSFCSYIIPKLESQFDGKTVQQLLSLMEKSAQMRESPLHL